jgi:type II secretory pathway predicted ATPase ExeA
MYEKNWGFARQPFTGELDPARYHANPMHEEALARLQFLIDQRRRLGLLTGAGGTGKTLLFSVLANRLEKQNQRCIYLNLTALDPTEFPWILAARLGLNPSEKDLPVRLWRLIADRVAENRYQQIGTVLLLDDADQAPSSLLPSLLRLTQCDLTPAARLSLILCVESEGAAQIGTRLLELTELRIELEPWDQATTASYLAKELGAMGGPVAAFEPRAAERIHQLCAGIPRRINHLADLALAAATGTEQTKVDAATVDAVYDELVGSRLTEVGT